jgi:HK97 gp10 family phage protein
MSTSIKVNIKKNKLPTASATLDKAVKDIVQKYLSDVDNLATPNVPVDTGELKNSKVIEENRIAWTAEYAAFVNDGTRYQAAQPFATDATEKALPPLNEALAQVEGELT